MLIPTKSLFQRILEGAAIFALACYLIKLGICMLQSIWGWLILLVAITLIVIVGYRFYKHHKDSQC